MPLELRLESDRAIVSSDDNDWIQHIHNEFTDSDLDSIDVESIEEIFEKLGKFNILGLLNLAIRLRDLSTSLKGRISSALTNLGFRAPRVPMDQEGRCIRCGSPTSWDSVGLAAEISGDTSSDAAFGWFRNQLESCVQNHRLCNEFNIAKLPPRVLDLGPPGTAGLDTDIKLVSTLGLQDRYVCLGYCWGGTIDIRLLRNRYHGYLRRIPWDILPQGYQDAIELTRKLGIRYIWIDSLCIVQDDEDDWRQQASLMAQIFRNA
ncbi:heterokaryon incompatibility protein [Fusarium proliferatum]|nr:heterokaryon incompatibility protein [Fusarium proliferatum]